MKDISSFSEFLQKFPVLEPPIVLSTDSHHVFSKENPPLQQNMIYKFIIPNEDVDPDEFTEYIPCFALPFLENEYFALVYWKAELMTYSFVMMTFDKKGNYITHQRIGGTTLKGSIVQHSITNIDEELLIHMMSGEADTAGEEHSYEASSGVMQSYEILETGDIVSV